MRDLVCCLAGSACAVSVSFYCSDKQFGDALGIDAAPEEVQSEGARFPESWMHGKLDARRVGCTGTRMCGNYE